MRSASWVYVMIMSGVLSCMGCGTDDVPVSPAGTAGTQAASSPSGAGSTGTVSSGGTMQTQTPPTASVAGRTGTPNVPKGPTGSGTTPTAGTPSASPGAAISGSGGSVAVAAGSGGSGNTGAAGSAGAQPTDAAAPGEPKIPPIMGDCPMFESGTATIGGLGGITVQVGAMQAEKGPLIFYWHGTGQTAGMVNQSIPSDVRDEILGAGGIIISPSRSLGSGGDCSGTGTFYKDDFKVADLIVACGVKDHNIDPKRIYTTGCSAGGLHAGCMANMRASYLAAAVPNSGGIIGMQPKDDPHVPALMTMHGGPGDVVIVTFSETSKTLYTAFAAMGGTVINCNHGGGHCGAPAALERAAWQFMKENPFGTPNPYAGGLPSEFPEYCEIIK